MMQGLPPITRTLIYANVGVFLLQMFSGDDLLSFALWPYGTPMFHVWQMLTYGFLHGGFTHLFFNMFGLYMFGPEIERVLGTQKYLTYYLACVVGAALLHLLVTSLARGLLFPTVGASGGLFGVLLAFGMFFPQRIIVLLLLPLLVVAFDMVFPLTGSLSWLLTVLLVIALVLPQRRMMSLLIPIPMKAGVLVTVYGAAELLMGVFGTMQGVAHFAHLGGMLAGFILLTWWKPQRYDEPQGW